MWIDPIDWSDFKEDLIDWSIKYCPNLSINSITDSKFRERLIPSHSPRSCALGMEGNTNIYQFFSLIPPRHEILKEMMMKGVPVHIANSIYKISKHNCIFNLQIPLQVPCVNLIQITVKILENYFFSLIHNWIYIKVGHPNKNYKKDSFSS